MLDQIAWQALAEHHLDAPGVAKDEFHFLDVATHAAAVDKLTETEGMLLVCSSEAGTLLCPSYASGSDWKQMSLNLQRCLEAAQGGGIPKQTLADRQKKRTAPTRAQAPGQQVPPAAAGSVVRETTVTIALLHQPAQFLEWWVPSEVRKPCGLAPRFCFSFGAPVPPPSLTALADFGKQVADPFFRQLFRCFLLAVGPKRPRQGPRP